MKAVVVRIFDDQAFVQLDVEHDDDLGLAIAAMIDDLQLVHRWISGGMTIEQSRARLIAEHDRVGMVRV